MSQEKRTAGLVGSAHTETRPTPIWISKRTQYALLLGGLGALVLLMWFSPSVPIMLLGEFALAATVLKELFDFCRVRLRTTS